jgi:hypothetical protein
LFVCLGVAWQVDILHPCTELEWRECRELPVNICDAQAVWLGDKLYVGGGWTSESRRDDARLYIHTPTTDTWSHIDTPVYYFALITYHSQLMLVGGTKFVGEYTVRDVPVTNKLWTLIEHDQWRETLPPMKTKRHKASAVEFANKILVAGGKDDEGRDFDIVEVYNDHHWAEAQYLPKPCCFMKFTVLNGIWYLMGGQGQELPSSPGSCFEVRALKKIGGHGDKARQVYEVYYASLDSLVASCRPSGKPLLSVWKRLSNVPHVHSSTAVFGNRLITVGGKGPSSFIHAYSPHTRSWVYVGDMPVRLESVCTAVLPTGDLMVIGGYSDLSMESCVHKASLKFNGNACMHTAKTSRSR